MALFDWWPAFFAFGSMAMICTIDTSVGTAFPPKLDFSGAQAKYVATSPWFFGCVLPMCVGLIWIKFFANSNKLPSQERMSMVWWLVNMFWFHVGCDVFSGYWQTMPVLTEIYKLMSPAHLNPQWHESRSHLDGGYVLELFVEVPLAFWVLYLYASRDPARHIAEVFAASVQFAGTVMYYAPPLFRGETHCWLSYVDRTFGFMWILFPVLLMRRHLVAARPQAAKSGKKANGKKN